MITEQGSMMLRSEGGMWWIRWRNKEEGYHLITMHSTILLDL